MTQNRRGKTSREVYCETESETSSKTFLLNIWSTDVPVEKQKLKIYQYSYVCIVRNRVSPYCIVIYVRTYVYTEIPYVHKM